MLSLQSVTIHTDLGDVKVELFCEQCPRTSEVSTFQIRLHFFILLNIIK